MTLFKISSISTFRKRKPLIIGSLTMLVILTFTVLHLMAGHSDKKVDAVAAKANDRGFNMELPKAMIDERKSPMNKINSYKKADEDSARRRIYEQQDPSAHNATLVANIGHAPVTRYTGLYDRARSLEDDPKADELLEKLKQLKLPAGDRIPRSTPVEPAAAPISNRLAELLQSIRHPADTAASDPQLERLSQMLDKIIQVQQGATFPAPNDRPNRKIIKADSPFISATAPITIPAVVAGKQKLVAGGTIALRITEETVINNIHLPKDQLVYGTVSISNDRMPVTITAIRYQQSIFLTALQVYDLDGLPGIHIDHMGRRQAAQQFSDQSVGEVNLSGLDPTISGQMANAGIQAARSLFSRRVRQVRVSVHDGHAILLMNTRAGGSPGTLMRIPVVINANSSQGSGDTGLSH